MEADSATISMVQTVRTQAFPEPSFQAFFLLQIKFVFLCPKPASVAATVYRLIIL